MFAHILFPFTTARKQTIYCWAVYECKVGSTINRGLLFIFWFQFCIHFRSVSNTFSMYVLHHQRSVYLCLSPICERAKTEHHPHELNSGVSTHGRLFGRSILCLSIVNQITLRTDHIGFYKALVALLVIQDTGTWYIYRWALYQCMIKAFLSAIQLSRELWWQNKDKSTWYAEFNPGIQQKMYEWTQKS